MRRIDPELISRMSTVIVQKCLHMRGMIDDIWTRDTTVGAVNFYTPVDPAALNNYLMSLTPDKLKEILHRTIQQVELDDVAIETVLITIDRAHASKCVTWEHVFHASTGAHPRIDIVRRLMRAVTPTYNAPLIFYRDLRIKSKEWTKAAFAGVKAEDHPNGDYASPLINVDLAPYILVELIKQWPRNALALQVDDRFGGYTILHALVLRVTHDPDMLEAVRVLISRLTSEEIDICDAKNHTPLQVASSIDPRLAATLFIGKVYTDNCC